MATLSYGGVSYTVDHAVKGADFIHGYDANNALVVSFEGVTNFSGFTYTGTYMAPADCLDEGCNDVKYHGGKLKKADGTELAPGDFGAQPKGNYAASSHTHTKSQITDFPSTMTPSAHNHAASEITSGTLATARGGTGQTTLTPAVTTKGVRSIYAGTTDMTAGSSSLTTGMLYFVYE